MKNVANQIKTIISSRIWLPASMLSTLNLKHLVEKMKRSLSWGLGGLNAKVLLNNQKKQIVLAVLHSYTEIVSIQSSDSITFRVIEGRLKLKSKNRTVFINKGCFFTLNDKEEYTLSNREETSYLLTMINKS